MDQVVEIDEMDPAEVARVEAALGRLLPALGSFLRFGSPDAAVTDRDRWRAVLDTPLPHDGAGLDTVLDELERAVIPYGLRTPHPGFSAYIVGRATTAGLAAGLAAQVAGHMRYFLTSFGFVEQLALDWLAELCHVRPGSTGIFSGGGSTANLIALGAARQAAYEGIGVDPAADGIPAGTRPRIYGSAEVHHTNHRAAGVLGLGRRSFAAVDADHLGRMDPAALDRQVRADKQAGVLPIAVVAVAGSTSTGAIDDLDRLADVAAEHGVWLHVDGAYGLPAACLPEMTDAFRGLERADSVITDPHKWLGTPVGVGATYVRDGELLHRAFQQEPEPVLDPLTSTEPRSQFDDHGPRWYDQGVELHAPSRGVLVWATLREIGLDGVRRRLRRHIGFARRLADIAEAHERLELLVPPGLSVCCFRYRIPGRSEAELDELNEAIIRAIRVETDYVPSSTRIEGTLAIRACYVNASTTAADVDGLASAVVAIGDRLTGELPER